MRPMLFVALTVVAWPAPAWTQAGNVRETALARIPRARSVAADPEIVKAVVAKNATREPADEIKRKDRDWTGNPHSPWRKALTTNACAQRLRELTEEDTVIVEAILMDVQGANVCVTRETTDYWQGDEPKFQKTVGEGKEVFVDEPTLDESSGNYAIQLSVPVLEGVERIGALTFTLRLRKPDAGSPSPP